MRMLPLIAPLRCLAKSTISKSGARRRRLSRVSKLCLPNALGWGGVAQALAPSVLMARTILARVRFDWPLIGLLLSALSVGLATAVASPSLDHPDGTFSSSSGVIDGSLAMASSLGIPRV